MKLFFLVLLTTSLLTASSIEKHRHPPCVATLDDCPNAGCGGDSLLNKLKNRLDNPSTDKIEPKTFDFFRTIHNSEPTGWRYNSDRGSLKPQEGTPIELAGYLLRVKHGEPEACNCDLTGVADNDFHLVLVEHQEDDESQSVTAEMTPRVREQEHPEWTYSKLKGLSGTDTKVRVTGWLMFDSDHAGESSPARISHWEIHPATNFEIETSDGKWVKLDEWGGE